jgi:hypothetical protein
MAHTACTMRKLFGWKCPGRGLARSMIHLSEFNWRSSLHDHRLGWLLGLATVGQIPYRLARMYRQNRSMLGERFRQRARDRSVLGRPITCQEKLASGNHGSEEAVLLAALRTLSEQERVVSARFEGSSWPPCCLARMCSTWKVKKEAAAWGSWQYSQRSFARCRTN